MSAIGEIIEKTPRGRPTAYKPQFAKQVDKLCQRGLTDVEIAEFFEVHVSTIYRWQIEHKDFCEAISSGKKVADERVERSLYHKAVGYKHDAVKIFMPAGAEKPVYAPYVESFAPDTTAATFWLKNRRPELWRDRTESVVTINVQLADRIETARKRMVIEGEATEVSE